MVMNVVPISLMVTLEVVKFFQAMMISWDVEIYDTDKDMSTKAQSSNLNEELGCVHYIFSDKTGTLTQNVMEFKKFSVNQSCYGVSDPDLNLEALKKEGITNVNFSDPNLRSDLRNVEGDNFSSLHRFMEILSVCHTVIAEKAKDGSKNLSFNASSPDELALVNAAKFFGYAFKGRDEENNMLVEVNDDNEDISVGSPIKQYALLNVIEFTSTRKRMTIIVKDMQNDTIRVMCKGADSIVIPRLKQNQSQVIERTKEFLDAFSKEGLRTLVIAEKIISEEFYRQWSKKYQNALTSTNNREENVNKVAEEIEIEFDLVGTTAIEDKLQDDVGDTLEFIKAAGIKVWVLTGDKIETAVNIGISCKLLNSDMETLMIDSKKTNEIMKQITQARGVQKMTGLARENAVIVAGDSLLKITRNLRCKEEFIQLA